MLRLRVFLNVDRTFVEKKKTSEVLVALCRLAVNNARRHTAARNCFASYLPNDARGKQTATASKKEGRGGAGCIKSERDPFSFPSWSTFRLIRLSATNLSVLSPFAFCRLSFGFSPWTFFFPFLPFFSDLHLFYLIFLPFFDVLLLLPPLSLACSPS